ncbi:hypothetical protein WDW89_22355 [Deltaproteobacteria bacterium TL4]
MKVITFAGFVGFILFFWIPVAQGQEKAGASSESHNPFSSLLESKKTTNANVNVTKLPLKSTSEAPPKEESHSQELTPFPQLKGILLEANGRYALIQIGKLKYLVKEGDFLGEYQLVEVQEKGALIQQLTRQWKLQIESSKLETETK